MSKYFFVKEPSGLDHADVEGPESYVRGFAGAGMLLNVYIAPTFVSFYRVQNMEVGEDANNNSGYFAYGVPPGNYTVADLSHIGHGAGTWHQLDENNSVEDHASTDILGLSSPWSTGHYAWDIPVLWKIDDGPEHSMSGWNQQFDIDALGTVTVSKFGHHVTRAINEDTGTAK